jgi:hypothetical protein
MPSRSDAGVIITYQASGDDREHAFLLFPKKIFERAGHTYAIGWSAHQPRSIRLWRQGFTPSGKIRHFRLDRISSVDSRPIPDHSLGAYVNSKIRRRGIAGGLWRIFLDLLVLAFIVGIFFSLLKSVFK